jgi:streptogramin lyase
MRYIIIIIIFFYQGISLQAQWRDAPFMHLGPNEGISGIVSDIAQDKNGYLYFGTDQGLYRYDGHEFTFYGHDPTDSTSISEREVFAVISATDGSIYLSTFRSGLNRFDPKTEKFERIHFPEHGLSDRTGARTIVEDHKGNIWIGGYHYYLYRYHPGTGEIDRYSPEWVAEDRRAAPGNDFRSVFPDRENENLLWLTVHSERPIGFDFPAYGLLSFDMNTETFSRVNGAGAIRYQDDHGHLWGSLWGDFITEIEPGTNRCMKHSYSDFYLQPANQFRKNNVSKDITSFQGQLIIASDHLISFDRDNGFRSFHHCGSTREPHCLFVDRDGLLWVGTDSGVEVYDRRADQIDFFSLDKLGEADRIYPGRLTYDHKRKCFYLIASTPSNTSRVYQISNRTNTISKTIETPFVPNSIVMGFEGEVLATGDGKLHALDTSKDEFNVTPKFAHGEIPFLYKLFESHHRIIGIGPWEIIWWNVSDENISRIKHSDWNIPTTSAFSGVVQHTRNELLASAGNQVFTFDLEVRKMKELSIEDRKKLLISDITGLEIDRAGRIWISIRSSLFQFERINDELRLTSRYSIKDGLKSPTIKEIFCDNYGRIWIFHNSGMNCLDIESGEMRLFGTNNGLPIPYMDPHQILEIENGVLATVCGNGLITWHPDSLWNSVEPRAVPIVIQNVQLNGESIIPGQQNNQTTYQLTKGPKVVTVNYQALAFPTDQNVTYRYRTGLDKLPWISVGNSRTMTLPNLPYGENKLEIQVVTAASNAPISTLILINPTPLIRRTWFPFALVAVLASVGFLFYRRRMRQIQHRADEETRVNKKLAELELTALRSQMNPHFMFNSLNSIKTYILEADPDTAADYLSQFAHLIRRILQHSREKLIPLEEEIETLQLYINLEQFRFENAFDFKLHVDRDIEIDEVMIPPLLLQPYIENAIWHGLMQKKSDGILALKFIDQGDSIECVIDDNGIGREKAAEMKSLSSQKHKSMGMGITANRVRILNQLESYAISIEVIDKKDENGALGTKVIARIPKNLEL